VDAIATVTGLSYDEIRRLLALGKFFAFVTSSYRLTDKGRKELRQWQAVRKPLVLPNCGKPYYPKQLRAGR
jgi:DNA-binding PadR family transcriptional regulator